MMMLIQLVLPLLGFLILWIAGDRLPKKAAAVIAVGSVAVSFVCAVFGPFASLRLPLSLMGFPLVLHVDALSRMMLLMITGVGALIHLYSVGYMHEDAHHNRFFSYLNLFVFFMVLLVLADSFMWIFVGWEGVGLCSYLLIGFWYRNESYVKAAEKAFVMNRIADLAFILALLMMIFALGTTSVGVVGILAVEQGVWFVTVLGVLLAIGAFGKSAQFPLLTWLPDAMAGPTPVSALIHAATMVTAGVYLICRAVPIVSAAPVVMEVIVSVGVITALFGGIVALAQRDIKKVLAYSTVSQLGFMFTSLGLGLFTVALFHMLMHAFFKAALFLGAGSVIHALDNEQRLSRMGGLARVLPVTHGVFLIGTLALTGFAPLAGFFSKDQILLGAYLNNTTVFWSLIVATVCTVAYMSRLYYAVFWDKPAWKGTDVVPHESPLSMTVPMGILAGLSVIGGVFTMAFFGVSSVVTDLLHLPHASVVEHVGLALFSALMMAGIFVLVLAVLRRLAVRRALIPLVYLSQQALGLDRLYGIWVSGLVRVSHWAETWDQALTRWAVVGWGDGVYWMGRQLRRFQSGFVQMYIWWVIIAVVAVFIWGIFL